MPEQREIFGSRPHLDYLVESVQFDHVGLDYRQEYWFCDCDFEMCMHTNCLLIKTFLGWHDVEVFALRPCDPLSMYVPVPSCWIRWEQSRPLLVPSPSVFAYFSGLLLHGSEAEWCIFDRSQLQSSRCLL